MSEVKPHPSYPNPTIREALCEVRFEREAGWTPELFSKFAAEVRDDFPIFEPVIALGVQVEIAPGAVGQTILPPGQLVRFRRATGDNLILQLGPGVFSVNLLPRYPGWDEMRRRFETGWDRLIAVIGPSTATRIGLRYVNLLPAAPSEGVSDWLQPSDYLPPAIVDSKPGFFYRAQFRPNEECQVTVTLARGSMTEGPEGHGDEGIILDTHCYSDRASGPDAVIAKVEGLHELAWRVFSSALTGRARAYLEGRQT